MKLKHWTRDQIVDFVREVREEVGVRGWELLVPRVRRALIAEKALRIVLLNAAVGKALFGHSRLTREAMGELLTAMTAEAGLGEP